ncbi:polymeric immunoglobulin receptor-like [Notolabrus celidotus]|uniref:polymeric immunoglobulin receptor-like n=1 Tax=Notolabrus celidotus TaxID=1203425 RepID=UPI00149037BA|nr:polymeric immunoglobulin receptor-like [Notolabrus celidotus]
MRGFVLLLLSLMTGCEAKSEVKGCLGGWVEFTCQYPNMKSNCKKIYVINQTKTSLQSSKTNEWITKERVSMYHNKTKGNLRVIIEQLQTKDAGEWQCKFGSSSPHVSITLGLNTVCQRPFDQTAYEKAKTTITCEDPDHEDNSDDTFICKESGPICEDILPTGYSVRSNETFTLTETHRVFSVPISVMSSQHKGVYWCGLRSDKGYRAGVRKITLKTEGIPNPKRSPVVGQTFSYWCKYSESAPINKFICKGEDPSVCQPLISNNNRTNGRFSMKDHPKDRNITITVRDVTAQDNGTYWCGAKRTDSSLSNPFYHRLSMIVVPSSKTTPVSTTQSTPASPKSPDRSGLVITVIVCVVALLLLFVLLSVLIYKRFSKRPKNGAASQHKEDYVYEEIQEGVRNPNSMKSVYATVNFPTNPSASLQYSTINFKQSPDKAAGDSLILKPSYSACEYSSVRPSPVDTYIIHPSRPSEEPLYSTVNKPQKK